MDDLSNKSAKKVTWAQKLSEILVSIGCACHTYHDNVDVISFNVYRYCLLYVVPNYKFDPFESKVTGWHYHTTEMEEHYITLDNVDGDDFNIEIVINPIIKDEKYWRTYRDDSIYIGHLIDNFYIKYEFIKRSAALKLSDEYILPDSENILGFNGLYPVVPKEIIIKNVGPKIIIKNAINNINTSTGSITTFNYPKCIAHGTYKYTYRRDLFKYINEAGELFALLIDPQTKEPTLVSKCQIIKLIDAENFKVYIKDGLYNGYKLKDNEDEITLSYEYVYIYNDVFFDGSFRVISDVRKPDSGKMTKPAAAAVDYN